MWVCDYIQHQAEKDHLKHSKDLHTSIVAAFSCLLNWVTLHPYLLGNKVGSCLGHLQRDCVLSTTDWLCLSVCMSVMSVCHVCLSVCHVCHVCLSVCLLCLSVCLSFCMYVMSVCLSVCLSFCRYVMSVCMYVMSVCLSVCLSFCRYVMSVCMYVMSVCLSVCLVCLSVCLSCVSVCLSVCLFDCLSLRPSVCPSISLQSMLNVIMRSVELGISGSFSEVGYAGSKSVLKSAF